MGVEEMPGLQIACLRQFIAGSIFVLYYLLFKKFSLPNRKQFKYLILMGLLVFVIANSVSTWSLQYIPGGLGALIGALYPLSVVMIEKFFFSKKNISPLTYLGFGLGVLGIAIVFYDHLMSINFIHFTIGLSMSIVAMISWSFGTVLIARNDSGLDPYYSMGWQMLISSVIVSVLGYSLQPMVPLDQISLKGWLILGYLIIIGSIISFIAFLYSMKVLPHAIASLFAYINPLVAIFLGAWILDEKLTMQIFWGSLVTIAGVYLVNYSTKHMDRVITEPEI